MLPFSYYKESTRFLSLLLLFLALVIVLIMTVYKIFKKNKGDILIGDYFVLLLLFGNNLYFQSQNILLKTNIPMMVPLFVGAAGIIFGFINVIVLISCKNETLTRDAIREGLDNLPMGIIFFDEKGHIRLINRKMHALSYHMANKDIQNIDEFLNALQSPSNNIKILNDNPLTYDFPNHKKWQFKKDEIITDNNEIFVQYMAVDVSDLLQSRYELEMENKRLKKLGELIKELSSKTISITREEELLSMKMYVHDEMGYNLLTTRKALIDGKDEIETDVLIASWQKIIFLLNDRKENINEQDLTILYDRAKTLGLELSVEGNLPKNKLIFASILECMTNSVKHGKASTIKIVTSEDAAYFYVTISNNGETCQNIVEGGGLKSLRASFEKQGGCLKVVTTPVFEIMIKQKKD